MKQIAFSTYLDAFANLQASPKQFADMVTSDARDVLRDLFANGDGLAQVEKASESETTVTITLALVLKRANDADPSELLTKPWGERQAALADQEAIWAKYGATQQTFDDALHEVGKALHPDRPDDPPTLTPGYLSTAQDRTLWLTLDADQFKKLFDTELLKITPRGLDGFAAWEGLLNLPDDLADKVGGIWIEQETRATSPYQLETKLVDPTILAGGNLGIGNGYVAANASPAVIAANYSFPLAGNSLATAPIALIEGGLPYDHDKETLETYFDKYRQELKLDDRPELLYSTLDSTATGDTSEFTLDISVVAGGAPHSDIKIYTYLAGDHGATPFNAYQRAFFDNFFEGPGVPGSPGGIGPAPVLSSSYPVLSQPTEKSPFQWAWQQLFIDGALRNVSTHVSAGDQGSSGDIANGLANVPNSQASPMALVVGGTSISDLNAAQQDPTLQNLVELALQGDKATIFELVAAGLMTLPSHLADIAPPGGDDAPADYAAAVLTKMFESVWNRLYLKNKSSEPISDSNPAKFDFGANETGLGGFASGVPVPNYQNDFGLNQPNRSTPDVTALAGGDYRYYVLNSGYDPSDPGSFFTGAAGTSAATPLWASLTAQFNAVLADQGLPYHLGFYNDLLYQSAVIAAGSFNDIRYGNNINSFIFADDRTSYANSNSNLSLKNTPYGTHMADGKDYSMIPTGEGYSAGESYDMASGLGTPNGLLLARTLSAIAHSQVYFSNTPDTPGKTYVPDLLHSDGSSAAAQAVLLQYMSDDPGSVGIQTGSSILGFSSDASSAFAWTSRFAQQTLQQDFDPALVVLFDKNPQGSVAQSYLSQDASLSVSVNGATGDAMQASMSNPFGFADFYTEAGVVRVARPVAIAETAGGLDDQTAIVRVRQGGQNDLAVAFYKVDDLAGTVNGVAPGQAGYANQVTTSLYQLSSGAWSLIGPGYGNFAQAELLNVDAGDMIAMTLFNATTGNSYYAFSQANPDGVGHIWNYGLNTYGYEDTYGGGDRDYNDLIVQLDFTSKSGSDLLV